MKRRICDNRTLTFKFVVRLTLRCKNSLFKYSSVSVCVCVCVRVWCIKKLLKSAINLYYWLHSLPKDKKYHSPMSTYNSVTINSIFLASMSRGWIQSHRLENIYVSRAGPWATSKRLAYGYFEGLIYGHFSGTGLELLLIKTTYGYFSRTGLHFPKSED